jgi:leucyl aminopeptidase
MLTVRLGVDRGRPDTVALPVAAPSGAAEGAIGVPLDTAWSGQEAVRAEVAALLADVEHTGRAGTVHPLPRPLHQPARLLLAGIGAGEERDWRAAGAALARSARNRPELTVALPPDAAPEAVRGLAEGAWLAGYRFRLAGDAADSAPKLRIVTLLATEPGRYGAALATARATVRAAMLARDLTNMPSEEKTPAWFAGRVRGAARRHPGLRLTVWPPARLAAAGFGGILAVGGGSARPPRLVELAWRPPRADRHVVLVGKGITFDTGGICVKPRTGMKLMRKDMGGAAAIVAATVGAAELNLPVRVTALAPLAENMLSGSAYRPGDVVRHYGGLTTEVRNTDAEGRLVLADALSYAVRELAPDVVVDLATLTGAQGVALGKRTAALYSDSDELAAALLAAADAAGERVWRMPLVTDYVDALRGDVSDLVNSTSIGAGSVLAALFLREFVGEARDRWAHLDMSAPAWADSADEELAKGATGWGVRTLLRWLDALAGERAGRAGALSPA